MRNATWTGTFQMIRMIFQMLWHYWEKLLIGRKDCQTLINDMNFFCIWFTEIFIYNVASLSLTFIDSFQVTLFKDWYVYIFRIVYLFKSKFFIYVTCWTLCWIFWENIPHGGWLATSNLKVSCGATFCSVICKFIFLVLGSFL